MSKDTIYRQDAIDSLDDEITITGISNAYVFKDYVQRVKRKLEQLPSAQPTQNERVNSNNPLDCISRQAAIDAATYGNPQTAWQRIEALPSAQPEQRWILCSERLPEEDTEVLISYRYKEGEGDTDHVNIDITSYGTTCFGGREIHTLKEWRQPFDYFHANYEVIAWMPLPEPYRKDGEADG